MANPDNPTFDETYPSPISLKLLLKDGYRIFILPITPKKRLFRYNSPLLPIGLHNPKEWRPIRPFIQGLLRGSSQLLLPFLIGHCRR